MRAIHPSGGEGYARFLFIEASRDIDREIKVYEERLEAKKLPAADVYRKPRYLDGQLPFQRFLLKRIVGKQEINGNIRIAPEGRVQERHFVERHRFVMDELVSVFICVYPIFPRPNCSFMRLLCEKIFYP